MGDDGDIEYGPPSFSLLDCKYSKNCEDKGISNQQICTKDYPGSAYGDYWKQVGQCKWSSGLRKRWCCLPQKGYTCKWVCGNPKSACVNEDASSTGLEGADCNRYFKQQFCCSKTASGNNYPYGRQSGKPVFRTGNTTQFWILSHN